MFSTFFHFHSPVVFSFFVKIPSVTEVYLLVYLFSICTLSLKKRFTFYFPFSTGIRIIYQLAMDIIFGGAISMSEERCKICGEQLIYTDKKNTKVCHNPKCPRYFKIPSEW